MTDPMELFRAKCVGQADAYEWAAKIIRRSLLSRDARRTKQRVEEIVATLESLAAKATAYAIERNPDS